MLRVRNVPHSFRAIACMVITYNQTILLALSGKYGPRSIPKAVKGSLVLRMHCALKITPGIANVVSAIKIGRSVPIIMWAEIELPRH
jgi:hypothetical protein